MGDVLGGLTQENGKNEDGRRCTYLMTVRCLFLVFVSVLQCKSEIVSQLVYDYRVMSKLVSQLLLKKYDNEEQESTILFSVQNILHAE